MKFVRVSVSALAIVTLTACAGGGGNTDAGTTTIELWTPQAGSPEVEVENMQAMLDAFTEENSEYQFEYKRYPFDSYTTSVQGAAAADDLPCMMAVDAPTAPRWAWAGMLTPLELPTDLTESLIPGAKGTYENDIYSVGYWDAGLAMYARQSVLDEHGIRIPTLDDPWTRAEFDGVLEALHGDDDFRYPVSVYPADIYSGTPFLWSFGGDILDRDSYLTAEDALNSTESVEYFEWLQGLVSKGYASGAEADGNPFVTGDVPLMWTGNWDAQAALDAFGDDVVFLPPPDFGQGVTVGAGSFGYGTSSNCTEKQREGVNEFLEFSMTEENLVNIADTQLVIPATEEAAAASQSYGPEGDFQIFAEMVADHSTTRPDTPGNAVVADIYDKATADILAGADVESTLDQAVADIDGDIQVNDGYGFD